MPYKPPTHRPARPAVPAHATRPGNTARGYDGRWRRVRAAYLASHPCCETPRCPEPATQVHHRDGRGPRGDNSPANLAALCASCHSRITAREARRR